MNTNLLKTKTVRTVMSMRRHGRARHEYRAAGRLGNSYAIAVSRTTRHHWASEALGEDHRCNH